MEPQERETITEMQELIDLAQRELRNLHDTLNPAKQSWTDRQFNQIIRILRETKELPQAPESTEIPQP